MANLKNLLVTGSARFVNTIKGTIEKAEKLKTARTIQTNLASTSSASFDGSANVTPGVSGKLPIANGGTNAASAADARTNLGLGSAATYAVETTLADDAKLPTGAAVQSYVTGLGYTSNTGTVTSVATGTGLTGGPITTSGTISLASGVVTAGSAGPTAAVTGNEGTTVAIPRITVDTYGRVTGLTSYNLTNKNTDTNTRRAFYGTCATAAATAAKVVTLSDTTGWELLPGTIVGVKFTYTNTASSSTTTPITLNVNGTGAKNIWYNTTHSGAGNTGTNTTIYGYANRYTFYMYDGTYWVWIHNDVVSNSNTVPSAQCETAAATAAKAATITNYTLTANTYLHVNIRYSNTAASALTFNPNSRGAKPIYINGKASSSSNYTLPAGSYIAFYNGTYWDFRTDGKLPADISGSASSLSTGTIGSEENPVYFNNGVPTPGAFTFGVDADGNITVTY